MAQNSSTRSESSTVPAPRGNNAAARVADDNGHGKTTIASPVVQKIAGMAAREIAGVHTLGGGVSRGFGAIRERIPGAGTTTTTGVAVKVGERQSAIDLDLVIEYGAAIVDVARAVRKNVITAVERMTGLEVNIAVNDVHLLEDDDQETQVSRVE
ncbi:MAG: Asp23/Gls24 family envelope stress response protein [Pseudonocardiaceae bacterium]|nr:Asp23/Gls24 family envelope stress response protein [Pseudonocardiaceae bacterium]